MMVVAGRVGGCWLLNPSPLEEQLVLLTPELSLQSEIVYPGG